jgi:hypothetical protein
MRYVTRFLGLLALSLMLSLGWSEGVGGQGGTGGTAGTGGMAGTGGTVGFPCTEQGIRDAIAEGGGPHTFDCDGPTTVVTTETIGVDNEVILDGGGNLTVDGNQQPFVHVFGVGPGGVLELRNFVITGAGTHGIASDGTVVLDGCVISANLERGIENAVEYGDNPTLTVLNSTISGNGRAGIINLGGTVTVVNSTISDNLGQDGDSGGIVNDGTLTVISSTLSGNAESNIHLTGDAPSTTMKNSIMDGSCLIDGNLAVVTSLGYNIESPGNTCGFDQTGDQVNVTAEQLNLGPLQDNGGPTMTHALGAGSVAIDQIPAEDCVDADGQPLTTDQRGFARDSMCDVGAYEFDAQEPPPSGSSGGCGCSIVRREDSAGAWLLAVLMLVGIRRVCRKKGS